MGELRRLRTFNAKVSIPFAFFAAIFLFRSTTAFSEAKSSEEFWRETDFPFEIAEAQLQPSHCYLTEKDFIACMYAFNMMLRLFDEPLTLVSDERYKTEKGFGETVATFDHVRIVKPKKFETKSALETFAVRQAERSATIASWTKLFSERDKIRVNLPEVIRYFKDSTAFKVRESEMAAAAVNTLFAIVRDPHTTLVPAAQVEVQMTRGGQDLVGIGIGVKRVRGEKTQSLVVYKVLEDGPAHRAGIWPNDSITAVNGVSIETQPFEKMGDGILGGSGSTVEISVLRENKPLVFKVVREKIKFDPVKSKLLKSDNTTVGYLRLVDFLQDENCDDLKIETRKLVAAGAQGLIFDLRNNLGGLLDLTACIANVFLDAKKMVVFTKKLTSKGEEKIFRTLEERVTDLPAVTLVNGQSASASEIVAGALQDYQRTFVLGERTFGKGTVQMQRKISKTVVIRETTSRFYLPSGRSNQLTGVIPDITVYRVPNATEEQRFALHEEDEYMALPPEGDKWEQPRQAAVDRLNECLAQGSAAARYEKGKNDVIPADYQMLVGQDAVGCIVKLGLWDAKAAVPTFAEPKLKEENLHLELMEPWFRTIEKFFPNSRF